MSRYRKISGIPIVEHAVRSEIIKEIDAHLKNSALKSLNGIRIQVEIYYFSTEKGKSFFAIIFF